MKINVSPIVCTLLFTTLTQAEEPMNTIQALKDLENFYDALSPAQENSKEAFAWFTSLPNPLFNAVIHLSPSIDVEEKVDQLIAMAPPTAPLSFWIHDENHAEGLTPILQSRDFQLIITCPLMTWQVKPVEVPSFDIRPANMVIFMDIMATNFHCDETTKKGIAEMTNKIDAENYLIYLDCEPVGTGTLFPQGKIGGIFNVSTLPEHQKKGCGTALMLHLMNRANQLNLDSLVLLSSPVAENLYNELAFTKVLNIEIYAK